LSRRERGGRLRKEGGTENRARKTAVDTREVPRKKSGFAEEASGCNGIEKNSKKREGRAGRKVRRLSKIPKEIKKTKGSAKMQQRESAQAKKEGGERVR